MDVDIPQLKRDLAAVLRKHGVSIEFTCDECSDTYGLSGDRIVIADAENRYVLDDFSWSITAKDLEEEQHGL